MSNIKTELQYRIALGILGQMCSAGRCPEGQKGVSTMEYAFYAEQTYLLKEGCVRARVLPAQKPEGRLYVDGFDSEAAARYYLEGLTDCKIMN